MDFYDKLVISITCIIVTFICVFNTFCFADTNVSISTLPSARLIESGSNFRISDSSTFDLYYFQALPGHTYQITCNYPFFAGSSSVEPFVGQDNISVLSRYTDDVLTIQYKNSSSELLYISAYRGFLDFSIIVVDVTSSLNLAVDSLVENVGIKSIWEIFEVSLPYVGVVVLAGFGFYLIFHNIKELSKGKERMN